MWIQILCLCIAYILWGIPTIKSTFDVANMVKTATVKDVPMDNDAILNKQACQIHVWENGISSPYFVVPLISARIPLISTKVSAHCQVILFMFSLFFTFILPCISITVYGITCTLKEQPDCVSVFPNICMIRLSNVIYIISYLRHHITTIVFTTCTTLLSILSYTTTLSYCISYQKIHVFYLPLFFHSVLSRVATCLPNGLLTRY